METVVKRITMEDNKSSEGDEAGVVE